ncbi:HK97 family phage protein [Burkholderia pseudomallei]|nr:HK97 family phage protein [Burkholderia pseudomallei]
MANLTHIVGLEGVLERMNELPRMAAMQINRGAANAMATKVRQQAGALAPVYQGDKKGTVPGQLRDAIMQRHLPELSGTYRQTYLVTVRRGKQPAKGKAVAVSGSKVTRVDAYYWTWVEFGHWYVPRRPQLVTRKTHRANAKNGPGAVWVQPRPFLRPAADLAADAAIQAAVDYYKKWLDRWVLTDTGWQKVKRAA